MNNIKITHSLLVEGDEAIEFIESLIIKGLSGIALSLMKPKSCFDILQSRFLIMDRCDTVGQRLLYCIIDKKVRVIYQCRK